MSDQQQTGASTSLEEVFLSREFGSTPPRGISSIGIKEEAVEPPQLEEVFLSKEFGHPEAVRAVAVVAPISVPPSLTVLAGGGDSARDTTRYRAIAAASGVAAAAIVVAGLATGTGQPSKQPTISAQGTPPGQSSPGPSGGSPGSGSAEQPAAGGAAAPGAASGSGSAATFAQLASATTSSAPQVVVEVPPGTTVEVVPGGSPAPSGPGGGTPPGATSPGGGGGGILAPVFVVLGNTVSTVGVTVSATSTDLGNALPVASGVTGLLGSLGGTVARLGQSVAGA